MADTIAAISTAQAPGGIGLIRVSGPQAHAIAGRVFTAKNGNPLSAAKGYTAHYGRVHEASFSPESGVSVENPEDIDEAIAIVYRGPASFTGEDVAELSCHGGL